MYGPSGTTGTRNLQAGLSISKAYQNVGPEEDTGGVFHKASSDRGTAKAESQWHGIGRGGVWYGVCQHPALLDTIQTPLASAGLSDGRAPHLKSLCHLLRGGGGGHAAAGDSSPATSSLLIIDVRRQSAVQAPHVRRGVGSLCPPTRQGSAAPPPSIVHGQVVDAGCPLARP